MHTRLAGVELGGTKAIAILAQGHRIIARQQFPTREPGRTLADLNAVLRRWQDEEPLAALGIASFGPLQLDHAKPHFGTMLATPKPSWSGAPIAASLTTGLTCPWLIDTDVNGAALAEYHWGAAQGCSTLCYITIGTGLGGGLLNHGAPIHGAMHPEIGHLRLRRAKGDGFDGICPFHGDCIEGLISGPALTARFGMEATEIADDHPLWDDVVADLVELCGTILLTYSAQRILFGGTVSLARPFLFPRVRKGVVSQLESYLPFLKRETAEKAIAITGLGDEAGPLGAIALAARAWPPTNR